MKRTIQALAILGALALVAGCNGISNLGGPGTSGSVSVPSDLQNVMVNDVSTDPNAAGIFAEDEQVDDGFATYGPVSPMDIYPDSARIRWWRKLTSSMFNYNSSGTPDSISVSASRTNTGLFKGALWRRAHRDSVLYDKPYSVTWSRNAIYKKIADPGHGHDGDDDKREDDTHWMLSRVSLSHTTQNSPGLAPPTILKVQLIGHDAMGNELVSEFTDPNELFDPSALPGFEVGDSIRVKVYTTGNDSNERAFLHFSLKSDDRARALRRPLVYVSSDAAFEGSFRLREGFKGRGKHLLRPRSAVWVDVLTKETIYDSDPGKYAATGWGLPFRVVRTLVTLNL